MVEPALRQARNGNIFQGMLEVGGEDAHGVKREHHACEFAESWQEQSDSTGYFAKPCDQNDLTRERNPVRHDQKEWCRFGNMGDTRDTVEGGQQPK